MWSTSEIADCWPRRMDKIGTLEMDGFLPYVPSHGIVGGTFSEQLIEATELATVTPPRPSYELRMDKNLYLPNTENGIAHFCNAQVEAIIYANQSFAETFTADGTQYRRGFYLGDGVGTGKCRTLAGIAHEHMLNEHGCKKKVLWFTGSSRAVNDIVLECRKVNSNNVEVLRYAQLLQRKCAVEEAIVSITYNDYSDEDKRKNIDAWLGHDFDGLILYDDAQILKLADPIHQSSRRALAATNLQDKLLNARVVYSSGTGSSDVRYLYSFSRLNLWGDNRVVKTRESFWDRMLLPSEDEIKMIPLQMKRRGVYLSRHLSYDSVEVVEHRGKSNEDFRLLYDRCTQLLELLTKFMNDCFEENPSRQRKNEGNPYSKSQYWSMCQSFWGQLVVTSKVGYVLDVCRQAHETNECCVIGLEHTCEAQFNDFLKEKWAKGCPFSPTAFMLRNIMLHLEIPIGCPKTYIHGSASAIKIGAWNERCETKADSLYERDHKVKRATKRSLEEGGTSSNGASQNMRDLLDIMSQAGQIKRSRIEQGGEASPDEQAVEDGCEEACDKNIDGQLDDDVVVVDVAGEEERGSFTTANVWDSQSVGSFLRHMDELSTPRNITWSYELVKQNVTAAGLARLYHELYPFLPINPLDVLLNQTNVTSNQDLKVVDLTGRQQMYLHVPSLCSWSVVRKPDIGISMNEFMNGEGENSRDVAVISAKSSYGIFLHADRECKNQRRRRHLTLEFGTDPVLLVQQLGQTHRRNQLVVPKYYKFKSQVPGEVRFTAILAERIREMGVLHPRNVQIANLYSENWLDEVYSNKGIDAINSVVREFYEEKQVNLTNHMQIMNLEYSIGRGWPKQEIHWLGPEITHALSCVLHFPLARQERFYTSLLKNLNCLQGKCPGLPVREIHLRGGSSPERIAEINTDGDKCIVYHAAINRCATFGGEVEPRMKTGNWTLYEKRSTNFQHRPLLGLFCKEVVEGCRRAIFPFCMDEILVPVQSLSGWAEVTQFEDTKVEWIIDLAIIRSYPSQCIHKGLLPGPCYRQVDVPVDGPCMHKWGIQKFLIITNPNAALVSKLKEDRTDRVGRCFKRYFGGFKVELAVVKCSSMADIAGLYVRLENDSYKYEINFALRALM